MLMHSMSFTGGTVVKNPPANVGNERDKGSIPGLEDLLEQEMATCSNILAWKSAWARGAWRATDHGKAKSQTRLSD